jgi:tRNA A64-2'-O-ribosylphosphate transferase
MINYQGNRRDSKEEKLDSPKDAAKTSEKPRRKKQLAARARHRLQSIRRDAQTLIDEGTCSRESSELIKLVSSWPLVANERCGSWYISSTSDVNAGSSSSSCGCYFKSTDGHAGTWNISLKRLNLSLIDLLQERGGCRLVDSSMRKILPDSFSRTIPIWACVLNRIVLKYRNAAAATLGH